MAEEEGELRIAFFLSQLESARSATGFDEQHKLAGLNCAHDRMNDGLDATACSHFPLRGPRPNGYVEIRSRNRAPPSVIRPSPGRVSIEAISVWNVIDMRVDWTDTQFAEARGEAAMGGGIACLPSTKSTCSATSARCGRAGWNIVTTSNRDAATNFRPGRPLGPRRALSPTREFYDAVTGLWRSFGRTLSSVTSIQEFSSIQSVCTRLTTKPISQGPRPRSSRQPLPRPSRVR